MKSNALGVVAGVAVGALIGILYAPEKGTVTRIKIKDKSRDLTDRLEHEFNDVVDKAAKKYNSIVESGESLLHKGDEFMKKEKAKAKAKVNAELNDTY